MGAESQITKNIVGALDRLASRFRLRSEKDSQDPVHLLIGRRGEELAYFYLRQMGYTVVARNWRSKTCKGELDLIAWENEVLCFVEVKTRTKKAWVPAEAAVDREKMREMASVAKAFLRQQQQGTPYRFDVVSVYLLEGQDPEIVLFRDAFHWGTQRITDSTFGFKISRS